MFFIKWISFWNISNYAIRIIRKKDNDDTIKFNGP